MAELSRTPLFELQAAMGAKFVPFAGWEMPINFGSQIAEHQAVRAAAGVFDVSHMTQVDISGHDAEAYLRRLFVGDVAALASGRALYTLALNEEAGILDDLMVYSLGKTFRVVFNASTREKMANWLTTQQSGFSVKVQFRDDLAMLAVQGPEAVRLAQIAVGHDLSSLDKFAVVRAGDALVGRTGYTGEDGLEFMLPAEDSLALWQRLRNLEVQACGLGARDTLRLEAGLNLYGQDMDQSNHPLESRLGWTIAWQPANRDFIGKARLQAIAAAGCMRELKGIRLDDKGVMRSGAEVQTTTGAGVVTSGSFSPTLGCSIGLARVPAEAEGIVHVIIRGSSKPASIVSPRFLAHTK